MYAKQYEENRIEKLERVIWMVPIDNRAIKEYTMRYSKKKEKIYIDFTISLFRRPGSSSGNSWSIGISGEKKEIYSLEECERFNYSLTISISNPTITIGICFVRWFKLSWYLIGIERDEI
jgi:hypothetical protein